MKVSKNNRDVAELRLKRGELSHADELCLREIVTCYDNKDAIDETIYSTGCKLLEAAYDAPFYPDELGNPTPNLAFLGATDKGRMS